MRQRWRLLCSQPCVIARPAPHADGGVPPGGCSAPLGTSAPRLREVAAPRAWVGVLVENLGLDLFFRPLLLVLGSPKCK